jgi:hypothetical protein
MIKVWEGIWESSGTPDNHYKVIISEDRVIVYCRHTSKDSIWRRQKWHETVGDLKIGDWYGMKNPQRFAALKLVVTDE